MLPLSIQRDFQHIEVYHNPVRNSTVEKEEGKMSKEDGDIAGPNTSEVETKGTQTRLVLQFMSILPVNWNCSRINMEFTNNRALPNEFWASKVPATLLTANEAQSIIPLLSHLHAQTWIFDGLG
ncbi:hypothetical protein RHMOL_Rhmol04G0059200 [Rhododendron molle]|uniref:Uncharacterized protein n=1 Tax=Rhododendron molle TaxID=49168 RepID=A0ACC0NXU9_RHOML|nr:hypothetical protein RHMOL_Rhmol04G0059200 [Rhododendron molle]